MMNLALEVMLRLRYVKCLILWTVVQVRTLDLRLSVAGSIPSHDTAVPGYF